jgi:hypothetical protein
VQYPAIGPRGNREVPSIPPKPIKRKKLIPFILPLAHYHHRHQAALKLLILQK